MNRLARILGRVAIIALATIVFAGLAGIYSGSIRLRISQGALWQPQSRQSEVQLSRFPVFVRQCVLFVLAAFTGRKVLRLHL